MIKHKDFAIKRIRPATWSKPPKFEPMEETILRVNGWIEQHEHLVLNVETIVLPNVAQGGLQIYKGAYKTTEEADAVNWWYQIFRVCYQA